MTQALFLCEGTCFVPIRALRVPVLGACFLSGMVRLLMRHTSVLSLEGGEDLEVWHLAALIRRK
jgi:hypothetical protein